MFNTSRQIGGAFAVAGFGALLAQQGVMQGLRTSPLIAAGAALAAAAANVLLHSLARRRAAADVALAPAGATPITAPMHGALTQGAEAR